MPVVSLLLVEDCPKVQKLRVSPKSFEELRSSGSYISGLTGHLSYYLLYAIHLFTACPNPSKHQENKKIMQTTKKIKLGILSPAVRMMLFRSLKLLGKAF